MTLFPKKVTVTCTGGLGLQRLLGKHNVTHNSVLLISIAHQVRAVQWEVEICWLELRREVRAIEEWLKNHHLKLTAETGE